MDIIDSIAYVVSTVSLSYQKEISFFRVEGPLGNRNGVSTVFVRTNNN